MKQNLQNTKEILANTYSIYVKTQNYHWNVKSPHFAQLHSLFETQYEDLASAVDQIAERIRALGDVAPAGFKAFEALRSLKDGDENATWQDMIKDLVSDHAAIGAQLKTSISECEAMHDNVTLDMFVERLSFHEKAIWMLSSHL